jgi:hypothetical protein
MVMLVMIMYVRVMHIMVWNVREMHVWTKTQGKASYGKALEGNEYIG